MPNPVILDVHDKKSDIVLRTMEFGLKLISSEDITQEIITWIKSELNSPIAIKLQAQILPSNRALVGIVILDIKNHFEWENERLQLSRSNIMSITIVHDNIEERIYPS